jgi:hypothetical protein
MAASAVLVAWVPTVELAVSVMRQIPAVLVAPGATVRMVAMVVRPV